MRGSFVRFLISTRSAAVFAAVASLLFSTAAIDAAVTIHVTVLPFMQQLLHSVIILLLNKYCFCRCCTFYLT